MDPIAVWTHGPGSAPSWDLGSHSERGELTRHPKPEAWPTPSQSVSDPHHRSSFGSAARACSLPHGSFKRFLAGQKKLEGVDTTVFTGLEDGDQSQ